MNNKLQLIKGLRSEVEDLTISTDEAKIKHYDCLQKIENVEDEIDTMEDKWSNDRRNFEDAWQKKIGARMYPISSVLD